MMRFKLNVLLTTTLLTCLSTYAASETRTPYITKEKVVEFYKRFADAKLNGGNGYPAFYETHLDDDAEEIMRITSRFPDQEKGNSEKSDNAKMNEQIMKRNKIEAVSTIKTLSEMNKYKHLETEILNVSYDIHTGHVKTKVKTTANFDMYRNGFKQPFNIDETMICDDILTMKEDKIVILHTDCAVSLNVDRRL